MTERGQPRDGDGDRIAATCRRAGGKRSHTVSLARRHMGYAMNGKVCYIELPASNIAQSANFYTKVFGWSMRTRGDGAQAFDDATGQVSGAFVSDRKPIAQPGLLVYIMVDDALATSRAIEANGGTIVEPVDSKSRETIARFADPGGNVLGIYQEPRAR
jgi:predicted enzyme related to lactoylglutathione lyase